MVALFGFPMLLSIPTSGSSEPFFKDAGREGDWNTALSLGNPAALSEVKAYLKAFTSEQLQAAVTPKQATPLFLIKIVPLSCLIQGKCYFLVLLLLSYFVYARDAAFFKTLFFSGDRANVLTLVKTQEIMRFPQTMVSCSITYGANPSEMDPQIFSAFAVIPIRLFALLRP